MSGLSLVPAKGPDLDLIMALERAPGFREFMLPWPREKHERAMADPAFQYLLIKAGSETTTPTGGPTPTDGSHPSGSVGPPTYCSYGLIHEATRTHQGSICFDQTISGFVILQVVGDDRPAVEIIRIAASPPGNGIGQQVLALIKSMAFEDLGARRLWLDVFDYNERARHVYRKAGFVDEALFRESIQDDGESKSLVIMAIAPPSQRPEFADQEPQL